MTEIEILKRQIELKRQIIMIIEDEIAELKQKLNDLKRLGKDEIYF